MKILLKALGGVCVLWIIFAVNVSCKNREILSVWGDDAIEDAKAILERSGDPTMLDGKLLTVRRSTLALLKARAGVPTEEATYRVVSLSFALLAAASLLTLSRRTKSDKPAHI